jgi:hypothetical protein
MNLPKGKGPAMADHEFMLNKQILEIIENKDLKASPVKKPF